MKIRICDRCDKVIHSWERVKVFFYNNSYDGAYKEKEKLDLCPQCYKEATTLFKSEKPEIITLCGSTKFKDEFLEVQKKLTLEGKIVLSVGLFGHSGDDEVWTNGNKEKLDKLHKYKIFMSDGIYVINVGGYIGESTAQEIEYAKWYCKKIQYLEEIKK